ncbi:MraY family glycosyltransferase [Pseudomonas azotoformans]|uniref:MraY family glycosyltransferase n=1 Tax=Pseudomonas azotoformans TaxID=47878 RepID=UPI0009EDB5DB|nr:glycosyltransferase family 4 protein [Pseudomonas azotoformans]
MIYTGLFVLMLLSFGLTAALRRYALSQSMLDIPNARSSHQLPTPRGGGVAIVLSLMLFIPMLYWFGLTGWTSAVALVGSGVCVATIGFMDDHGHIAARWRLLGHFASASWAVFWLGGLPSIHVFSYTLDLGLFGDVLAIVYLVWLLNLYNFMDGINGIASTEAIFVCVAGTVLYLVTQHEEMIWVPLAVSFAVVGFLFWNFPVARIFMGDAGSGFLGVILAILSIQAAWTSPQLFWSWIILLGVFIVDATFTLLRRLLTGQKVYEAHRTHAYQYASRMFGSHSSVTLSVLCINLLWLFPIACFVALQKIDGVSAMLVAYFPLTLLALKFRAGKTESFE